MYASEKDEFLDEISSNLALISGFRSSRDFSEMLILKYVKIRLKLSNNTIKIT